jgi:hypothetical protein
VSEKEKTDESEKIRVARYYIGEVGSYKSGSTGPVLKEDRETAAHNRQR